MGQEIFLLQPLQWLLTHSHFSFENNVTIVIIYSLPTLKQVALFLSQLISSSFWPVRRLRTKQGPLFDITELERAAVAVCFVVHFWRPVWEGEAVDLPSSPRSTLLRTRNVLGSSFWWRQIWRRGVVRLKLVFSKFSPSNHFVWIRISNAVLTCCLWRQRWRCRVLRSLESPDNFHEMHVSSLKDDLISSCLFRDSLNSFLNYLELLKPSKNGN